MSEEDLKNLLSAPIVKRSVVIAGHASSVTIEEPFWIAFKALAEAQNKSINKLVTELDDARPRDENGGLKGTNLSSAIRLYVLSHKNN